MNPLQQLLMLLSGTSQGGLSGGLTGGQMQAPSQMRLSGGLNTSANNAGAGDTRLPTSYSSFERGFNPGTDPDQIDKGDKGDGKGDKGDREPELSQIMREWRNAVDQGPSGYTPAMRQNLGMNASPVNFNDRSGMASFMDLFMGNNFGQRGGNDRRRGGDGHEGPGFGWLGDQGDRRRGGDGHEGPGFRWLGDQKDDRNNRVGNFNWGSSGGMHPLRTPMDNNRNNGSIMRPGA